MEVEGRKRGVIPIAYFLPGGRGRDFSVSVREVAYFSFAATRVSVMAVIVGA